MHTEIDYAVKFIVNTIEEHCSDLSDEKIQNLKRRTTELLQERYDNHWYSDKPMKGSAFRCINISIEDDSVDSVVKTACEEVGISREKLFKIFNKGLALWVDPYDVSCRLGKGAIFPIYKKIMEKKSKTLNLNAPVFNTLCVRSHQQRPRSASPPHIESNFEDYQQKPRSLTPPGFSSMDAGQILQKNPKPHLSQNIHQLWNNIPNTSSQFISTQNSSSRNSYMNMLASHDQYATSRQHTYDPRLPVINSHSKLPNLYNPESESVYKESAFDGKPMHFSSMLNYNTDDSSYSFNQYSSYYNPADQWKKNVRGHQHQQHLKSAMGDSEVYNRYYWSHNSGFDNSVNSINPAIQNLSFQNNYSSRHAQEAF